LSLLLKVQGSELRVTKEFISKASYSVIPAKAGIQENQKNWIPAKGLRE